MRTQTKEIKITSQSIRNRLHGFSDKPGNAILEYVWNGFDAEAKNVYIRYGFKNNVTGGTFGYADFEISDDGTGWNVDNEGTANLFLDSSKKHLPYKSLPQGREGVGRFTFFSFASTAAWETVYGKKKFKLTLDKESLDKYEWEEGKDIILKQGTKVSFYGTSGELTESFFNDEFIPLLKQEFCWFLRLSPQKNIFINGELLDISDLIRNGKESDVLEIDGYKFTATFIQWRVKPLKESSKYYFLDEDGEESFKKPTGLNYQSDDFFHSVYVQSDFFNDHVYWEDSKIEKESELLPDAEIRTGKKEVYKKLLKEITGRAELMRRPYLEEISSAKILEWKKSEILPNVTGLGVDQGEYEALVKGVYVAVPKLLSDANDDQKKVILRFFSSLMSTEERDFILKILDEVYRLPDDDKKTLKDLLERATLSNIVKTLREIDSRFSVLASLEEILFDSDKSKYTREVDHLQRVLDQNFWIFGEEFKLLASTEGSIRKSLIRFKDKILRKDDEVIKTKSRKELDLFLAKEDQTSKSKSCVVVEIKRPSIVLGKKEYDQIMEYIEIILKEPACNGSKISWRFYLIGCEYDSYIERQIDNVKEKGERNDGLVFTFGDNAKLYIKKWSDIINVEHKSRYKFIQEKLNLESKDLDEKSSQAIVDDIVGKK